jgi:hypothetical protein
MTIIATALKDFPGDWIEVACDKCGRHGRLRKERLIAEHGGNVTMPDLRHLIAECARRHTWHDPCDVHYVHPLP